MAAPVNGLNGPAIATPKDWNNFGTTSGRAYWNKDDQLLPAGSFSAFDQTMNATSRTRLLASLTDNGDGTFTTVAGITPAGPWPSRPAPRCARSPSRATYLRHAVNGMNISAPTPIKGVDGENEVRRTGIVDLDSCNTCHERIGFHSNAGRMANVEYCSTCHNPELSNSNIFEGEATFPLAGGTYKYTQTSNNFKDMIHSIHAAPFREEQNPEDPYNFIRGNPLARVARVRWCSKTSRIRSRSTTARLATRPARSYLPEGAAAVGLGWSVYDAHAGPRHRYHVQPAGDDPQGSGSRGVRNVPQQPRSSGPHGGQHVRCGSRRELRGVPWRGRCLRGTW